ncbi:tRNA dihydrouridine synthase DusB [Sediminicurvatus halobius]|uniref:tRNA-dihydrouridine synthase B n=1 Tax=Sediminicurvatus halobius TaxID=2182432 RepID=A0A2U2N8V9_9GAMM|nr:tRNA dihydrouridine synthase DusB [Spiribacter halobius]PWG65532.1 tRNA dihydrouridine synthase DusB [Spiribacter halobius]UEX76557.1 tRNA dihydrouridine synthase DusB [Spiribacter halobius]
MKIGPYSLPGRVLLAPMAGVTDRPFRILCRHLGAALAASEMVASNPALQQTRKSRLKRDHAGEPAPRVVQIAGAEPAMMAEAACFNVAHGAQIIDINMGCPAKKVCNRQAGSALLADEPLVARILEAVVRAVPVPVTLKIRTGPAPERRNAVRIARLAEDHGIAALAVHGRTRDQAYRGEAEYDTIARVREAITLPLIANGDIDSPERAARVLRDTGADAVMIGRAAQGRPWIFREIQHYLDTGAPHPPATVAEVRHWMLEHLRALHRFYGATQGVRIARKHIGWYLQGRPGGELWRRALVRVDDAAEQLALARRALEETAAAAC